jgi:hypothetical protein
VNSQALLSAFELGVFDALADGPTTAEDVAKRAGIHPVACRRLLMTLASLDLVACNNGTFTNTELGQFCSSRAEVEIGAVSKNAPFYHMCEHLSDALREQQPAVAAGARHARRQTRSARSTPIRAACGTLPS